MGSQPGCPRRKACAKASRGGRRPEACSSAPSDLDHTGGLRAVLRSNGLKDVRLLRRPRLPMTAHGVGPSTRPTENWQHPFLLLDLNRHRANGSHIARIETRWRNNMRRNQQQKQIPYERKRGSTLDRSDLLIETPFAGSWNRRACMLQDRVSDRKSVVEGKRGCLGAPR